MADITGIGDTFRKEFILELLSKASISALEQMARYLWGHGTTPADVEALKTAKNLASQEGGMQEAGKHLFDYFKLRPPVGGWRSLDDEVDVLDIVLKLVADGEISGIEGVELNDFLWEFLSEGERNKFRSSLLRKPQENRERILKVLAKLGSDPSLAGRNINEARRSLLRGPGYYDLSPSGRAVDDLNDRAALANAERELRIAEKRTRNQRGPTLSDLFSFPRLWSGTFRLNLNETARNILIGAGAVVMVLIAIRLLFFN